MKKSAGTGNKKPRMAYRIQRTRSLEILSYARKGIAVEIEEIHNRK